MTCLIICFPLTLHETPQHLTPRLQQRMPDHQLQKPLQAFPSMLNHVIAEPICKHLSRQRRDRHPCALPFQNVAEVFKVTVAAADHGVAQLERRDVRNHVDLVAGVHVAAGGAVGLGILHLRAETGFSEAVGGGERIEEYERET